MKLTKKEKLRQYKYKEISNKSIERENMMEEKIIIADLKRQETQEFKINSFGFGFLHRDNLDSASFMDANKENKMVYAKNTGAFAHIDL